MRLTNWFPAHQCKPARVGWYEYRSPSIYDECGWFNERCWWNGKKWLDHPDDPKIYGWPGYKGDAWRGVLK